MLWHNIIYYDITYFASIAGQVLPALPRGPRQGWGGDPHQAPRPGASFAVSYRLSNTVVAANIINRVFSYPTPIHPLDLMMMMMIMTMTIIVLLCIRVCQHIIYMIYIYIYTHIQTIIYIYIYIHIYTHIHIHTIHRSTTPRPSRSSPRASTRWWSSAPPPARTVLWTSVIFITICNYLSLATIYYHYDMILLLVTTTTTTTTI